MVTGRIAAGIRIAAIAVVFCAIAILATSSSAVPAVAKTPAGGALSEPQDVNGAPGVVAEIVQCKREDGVLSIRMRLRNTGSGEADFDLANGGSYDQYYVTAGNKKYFVLRDSEKTPLANPINGAFSHAVEAKIPKGGAYMWCAKYPAPPDEVKRINYYTPITPPFEDVPVSD